MFYLVSPALGRVLGQSIAKLCKARAYYEPRAGGSANFIARALESGQGAFIFQAGGGSIAENPYNSSDGLHDLWAEGQVIESNDLREAVIALRQQAAREGKFHG